MRRFVFIALLVLLPVFAFGAEKSLKGVPFPEQPKGSPSYEAKTECQYFIDGSSVSGVTCRDKCFKNERLAQQIEVPEGEHKGMQACLTCFEKGVKDANGRAIPSGKVPCLKQDMYPTQAEFNVYGYLILLAVFFTVFICLVLGDRKMDEDARSGILLKICVSLFAMMFFLLLFENYMDTTYYVKINQDYLNLFELCFGLLFAVCLYSFVITIGWSFYKFTVKQEITPFLYRIIKFADFIKRETGI